MVLTLAAGQALEFPAVTGQVSWNPDVPISGPVGDTNDLGTAAGGFGLYSVHEPRGGLVGVFVERAIPPFAIAPTNLDFASATTRNQTNLAPLLRQVFYIWSGRT